MCVCVAKEAGNDKHAFHVMPTRSAETLIVTLHRLIPSSEILATPAFLSVFVIDIFALSRR